MNALDSLHFFVPEIVLLAGAFAALILDLFTKNKSTVLYLSLGVLIAAAFVAEAPEQVYPLFYGFFTLDAFTHFFRYAILGIVGITLLLSLSYKPFESSSYRGEFSALMLFLALGLIMMAASTNLLMIFLSIEFVSLISYILVGYLRTDPKSKEASIKYLLFGSIASGLMLFGMSYAYGLTGSLDLAVIGQRLMQSGESSLAVVALLLILAGIGFKISMAPFHMWAPDVYEGAPTPVTAFLTVAPKALGFAVIMRVLSIAFPSLWNHWSAVITALSILTMTLGNVIAISQTNIKRLLAYSSIAQAGYILMGIAVFSETGLTAVLVYLVAYAFTNLGAFAAVIIASNHLKSDEISDYAGLATRSPFLAASITIFLLSLAGIPPLAGFIGKLLVFSTAIEAGFITLAVAAALNSAIAAYYYFKVVRVMYLVPAENTGPIPQAKPLTIALSLMLIGTFFLGVMPAPLIAAVHAIFA